MVQRSMNVENSNTCKGGDIKGEQKERERGGEKFRREEEERRERREEEEERNQLQHYKSSIIKRETNLGAQDQGEKPRVDQEP